MESDIAIDEMAVSISSEGAISASLMVPESGSTTLQIEVVVRARGRLSVPEASRSNVLTLDNEPPPPPVSRLLRLRELAPAVEDPNTVQDSNNRFELSGNLGAFTGADRVIVYASAALLQPLADISLLAGVLEPQTLPHVSNETFYVVSVDGAGNRSEEAVPIEVPQFSDIVVSPVVAKSGDTITVAFQSHVPLLDLPELSLGEHQGVCFEIAALSFSCDLVADGAQDGGWEGLNAAVLRLWGQHGLRIGGELVYASGTEGTSAVTTTLDFTPPEFDLNRWRVGQSDPGQNDSIEAQSAAFSDFAGGDSTMETLGVGVQLFDQDDILLVQSERFDGALALFNLGDNQHPSVRVVLEDEAGNRAESIFENDIEGPVIDAYALTPAFQRDGQRVTATFTVEDQSDLRLLPTVRMTDGGALASIEIGDVGTAASPIPFSYAFDVVSANHIEAAHNTQVTATDAWGNVSSAQAALVLDYTAPASANDVPGARAEWKGFPAASGTASDVLAGVATVEVQVVRDSDGLFWDGAQYAVAESWLVAVGEENWSVDLVGAFVEGERYSLRWRSTDRAGNAESIQGPQEFAVDNTPPDTTIDAMPPSQTSDLDPSFTFGCSDLPCTFECALDGALFLPCPEVGTPTFASLVTGAHHLEVRAVDVGLNEDPSPAIFDWTILRDWQEAAVGGEHVCAIAQDGRLWCWGNASEGRLGFDSTNAVEASPVVVGNDRDWISISAGIAHSCALKSDGGAWCWGRNFVGQVGTGDSTNPVLVPTEVEGAFKDWDLVVAGHDHSCGIRDDGNGARTLWCWGRNSRGELGVGDTTLRRGPEQEASGDTNWLTVALGGNGNPGNLGASTETASCGIKGDNTLWCWGAQEDGRLGNGIINSSEGSSVPVREQSGASDWTSVSMGAHHACALRTNDSLWCWGNNALGELGVVPSGDQSSPVQESTGAAFPTGFTAVAANAFHTVVIGSAGNIGGFGEGNAALGVGGFPANGFAPTLATYAAPWVGLSNNHSGHSLTCAWNAVGELGCAGSNITGQMGRATVGEARRLSPVFVRTRFFCHGVGQ